MVSPPASPKPPLETHEHHPDPDTAYYGHLAVPGDDQVDYVHEANLHSAQGKPVEASEGALAPATGEPTAPLAAPGKTRATQDLGGGRLNARGRARVDAKANTVLRNHR